MRRFINDESGVTMALAVIMIVLIGVMGAGLLTFVSQDLNAVVEVNQSQRAQEMADAGLEAAKRQLSIETAVPTFYDAAQPVGNLDWYYGKPLDFDGDGDDDMLVSIRYLPPSLNETEARNPNYAPEVRTTYYKGNPPVVDTCDDANGDGLDDDFNLGTPLDPDACNYENNRTYFRVTVRGESGNAVRQHQAILQAENFSGTPLANYASRNIDFEGSSWLMQDMSLFSGGNVSDLNAERIQGTDYAYGDWATIPGTASEPNPHNTTPRVDASGVSVTRAGVGALGIIDYVGGAAISNTRQKAGTATPQRYGYRDYDTNTNNSPILRPEFVEDDWSPSAQPTNKITFPFEPGVADDDAQALALLKEKAQSQNLYKRLAPGSDFTIDGGDDLTIPEYPDESKLNETVMFIEFASGSDDHPVYGQKGQVTYRADSGNPDDKVKGIIVVMHGNLEMSNASIADTFQGAMIVRDGIDSDNAADTNNLTTLCNTKTGAIMCFKSAGNSDVEGYVNVEGDMRLAGTISGLLPTELYSGLPSLAKVSVWSWRECYNTTCS